MGNKHRVVIAMSGGVDSSVSAALLKQQGYDVIGMMLRLWTAPGNGSFNRCCSPSSITAARQVAKKLNIPFYAIDAQKPFYDLVVDPFIHDYLAGITPNPCLSCNKTIRWNLLLNHALAVGAQFLATGHYARIRRNDEGNYRLFMALDGKKDQSYVLHLLDQRQLSKSLFPLGNLKKSDVRDLAHQMNLPTAERNDSQDLCFVGNTTYQSFLSDNTSRAIHPGPIIDLEGHVIGKHKGLAFYTIGQRKGIGISQSHALYVLGKDIVQNALIVGQKHQSGKDKLIAKDVNWISGDPPNEKLKAKIKIRYKSNLIDGAIIPMEKNQVQIKFNDLVFDITPGQAAVFYVGKECLGGGIIWE